MSLLYLAGESEADEDFYAACAEKLTGRIFERCRLRNRKGSGVDAVRRQMKNALVMAMAATTELEPVFFLAAMDNAARLIQNTRNGLPQAPDWSARSSPGMRGIWRAVTTG